MDGESGQFHALAPRKQGHRHSMHGKTLSQNRSDRSREESNFCSCEEWNRRCITVLTELPRFLRVM
jgi:uncharacterized membrane protein